MKKVIFIKLSIFSVIGIAFTLYILYYSNALANQNNEIYNVHFSCNPFFDNNLNFESEPDTVLKTFSVDKKGSIYVNVSGADIDVNTWDKNEVKVIAIIKGTENRKKDYKIYFDASNNNINITAKSDKNFIFSGWLSVKFLINIPKEFYPNLNTSGGDIILHNLFSDSKLKTSGGDIFIENSIGKLNAHTSGGNIKVIACNGDVNLETSGGDIVLDNISGSVSAETSGGDIKLNLKGDNKGISLNTSGGDIHIETSKYIKADLDCKTSGGDVSLNTYNNFDGKIKEHYILGSINGGGPLVKARTSGGDISIKLSEW